MAHAKPSDDQVWRIRKVLSHARPVALANYFNKDPPDTTLPEIKPFFALLTNFSNLCNLYKTTKDQEITFMPHSESNTPTKMAPQVNGETPSSAFFSHLYSYPVISDSISTFKSNPYGAKSLDLTSAGYERIGKPLIPYLSKPYEYVSPYVKKADSIGDNTLSTIDNKFPVVKKPTGELYSDGKSIVFFPLKKGTEGKDYVFSTYNSEVKKVGGEGIVTYGKAAVSTSFIVGSSAYTWLAGFLSGKKTEAKEVTNEKLNN